MTDQLDPYAYPGSSVLRNKPGIVDAALLAKFEYEQSAIRMQEMRAKPVPGRLDLQHLQAIHRTIFQDVYDWAGEIRTVSISKGSSRFAEPAYIPSEAAKLTAALAGERNLQGLDKRQFVDRLSHYYAEWNALHPFREGNGRSTRELMGEIARQAGYELDQTRIENSKGQWNEAARQSFGGRLAPVTAIFTDAIRPSRSLAFETLTEREALARHPELSGAYEGLAELRSEYEKRYPDDDDQRKRFEAQTRAEIVRVLDTGALLQGTRDRVPPARERKSMER